MPATPSSGGSVLSALFGFGLVGFLLGLVFLVAALVFSAWVSGWWLRMLVRFHRGWFDREYARARGGWVPPRVPPSSEGRNFLNRERRRGPRDW
jgi:hypothetical protein